MRRLNTREKKVVAVGLLIILLALAYALIAAPIVHGFIDRAHERQRLIALYQRNQRVLSGMRTVRTDVLAERASDRRYAFSAPTQALAAEFLKERVSRTIVQQGGALKGLQDLQAEASPGELRLRADASLHTNQLYEVLRRLQTEDPHVVVEFLSVVVDPGASTGPNDPMDVRLEVSGRFHPAEAGRG